MDKLARRNEPALQKISANLARDLDTANEGEWVHVDRKGRIRSIVRYRVLQGVGVVGAGFVVSTPLIYGLMFGPVGAVVGVGFVGLVGLRILPARRLRRAAELIENGRLDDAETLLRKIAQSRTAHRGTRATATLNLAIVQVRRGNHEQALALVREASPRFAKGKRRPLVGRKADYVEAQLLASLGRVDEAQAAFTEIGPAPEAEYLRVVHWSVELYVLFRSGKHTLDIDDLHERTRKGLSMTTGAPLIALAAWAHEADGDTDQAEFLIGEARDRFTPTAEARVRTSMPALMEWLETRPPSSADLLA